MIPVGKIPKPRTRIPMPWCRDSKSIKQPDTSISPHDRVMSTLLISDQIFNRLKLSDILNLGLVSKNWNACSRQYLRRNRKFMASLDLGRGAIGLEKLQNGLENPFTGVCIFDSTFLWSKFAYSFKSYLLENAFYPIAMETVIIDLTGAKSFEQIQPFLELLPFEKMINLQIRGFENQYWEELFIFIKRQKFPKLEALHFERNSCEDDGRQDGDSKFDDLFNQCPNLSTWPVPVSEFDVPYFAKQEKTWMITSLKLTAGFKNAQFSWIEDAGLALTHLDMRDVLQSDYFVNLKRLLLTNIKSLKVIHTNLDNFWFLLKNISSPLDTVEQLYCYRKCTRTRTYTCECSSCELYSTIVINRRKVVFPNARISWIITRS